MVRTFAAAVMWALSASVAGAQALSDAQVTDAIDLGRAGNVPTVTLSTGDFNVSIDGPMGRIAAAAQAAFKQFRPFTLNDVTDDMRARFYRVSALGEIYARRAVSIQHIVLQPRGARGLDGVIQPTREVSAREAHFDRLPDGEFDIVIATSTGPRRYPVSLKDRAKLVSCNRNI